jgi:membrane protein DedA with SNARE-associated domain
MQRILSCTRTMLVLALALHLHHRFEGSPIGYAGIALASASSWIGLPGPGEPVLIAAGLFAAKNKLDITSVVFVAFVSATGGGIAGWLVGLKAGRRVMTTRGPLLKLRQGALARGDELFSRYAILAILLTPSWIAGIHNVRPTLYMITNVVSAAAWAVGIGLGAYFAGPTVLDFVQDLGLVTAIGLGLLIVVGVGGEVLRRKRARSRKLQLP